VRQFVRADQGSPIVRDSPEAVRPLGKTPLEHGEWDVLERRFAGLEEQLAQPERIMQPTREVMWMSTLPRVS
jgi:hypothetical protein